MSSSNKTKVYTSKWAERLVACIGMHATRKLVAKYGGTTIKVPKFNVLAQGIRNVEITRDWLSKKYTKKDLEQKYSLSYPTIMKAIKETLNDPRYKDEFKEP